MASMMAAHGWTQEEWLHWLQQDEWQRVQAQADCWQEQQGFSHQ